MSHILGYATSALSILGQMFADMERSKQCHLNFQIDPSGSSKEVDPQEVYLHRLQDCARDRDRERAQARAGQKTRNPKDDGLTPEQRRERDAKALQEKLAKKKAAQSAAGGNNLGGGGKAMATKKK